MAKPKILIAGFQHETNTFAPIPTDYDCFALGGAFPGLCFGEDARVQTKDINVPMGGFIREAGDAAELVPVCWTFAEPGGYVTDDAFDRITGSIVDAAKATDDLDAIYLDLHGAMVTRQHDDAEAEVLRRLREAVGPDLPIAVSLDLHANKNRAFFEAASFVTIYRTYPHVDMGVTGARAFRLLMHRLNVAAPLAKAYRQFDCIVPVPSQTTDLDPAKSLYGMLDGLNGDGVASVDFAFGFPPADVPQVGASIFAYGTDQTAVDAAVDHVHAELSKAEAQFDYPMIPAPDAVARGLDVANPAGRPVVIADAQDNPGGGTTGDTTGLLRAALAHSHEPILLGMMCDAKTAAAAHDAGQGARFEAHIGGAFAEYDPDGPFVSQCDVIALSDGKFTFTGPMFSGPARLGQMAALRLISDDKPTGIVVVVGSNRAQSADRAIFEHLGLTLSDYKLICLKSSNHFRGAYAPISAEILYAEAPGANPCNPLDIPFTRLRPGVRLGCGGPESSGPSN